LWPWLFSVSKTLEIRIFASQTTRKASVQPMPEPIGSVPAGSSNAKLNANIRIGPTLHRSIYCALIILPTWVNHSRGRDSGDHMIWRPRPKIRGYSNLGRGFEIEAKREWLAHARRIGRSLFVLASAGIKVGSANCARRRVAYCIEVLPTLRSAI
jgi:hypothetical protein